jgi:arylsulfatase A-like enzyme
MKNWHPIKSILLISILSINALLFLFLNSCTGVGDQKPNVILVMTDDQGYGDIGAHGSPYVKTPSLDDLHAESVRLTNFHVDPCCSPTRAALLTGQYSARSGVWHTIGGRSLLKKDKVTMADVFKSNGYRTAIFGKWHLGQNYPFRPQDRGFEEVLIHRSGSVGNRWDTWGNDYFDDTYIHNGKPEKFKGYCNTIWFDEAIKYIRKNREQPFFCYIPTNVPHAPLVVDEKYVVPYRSQVSDRLARYYGMVSKFDEDLGRFLQEIKSLGLEENTIFIFMTDNGPCPWFGGIKIDNNGFPIEGYSCGMRGGKIWGYENADRVPFFIRWPAGGIGGGIDNPSLTAHIDVLPTLIDLCELKKPDNLMLDGRSLRSLLNNTEDKWKKRSLIVQNQRVDFAVKYKEFQVLTDKWRLINPYQKEIEDMEKFYAKIPQGKPKYFPYKDHYELYDIITDPEQKKNVAAQNPAVVEDLARKYETWWEDVSKDFDEYPEIIIGSEYENPTILYNHDTHRKNKQQYWVLNVEKEGKYSLKLRRWPKESQKKIVENRKGNKKDNVKKAVLEIGNLVKEKPVNEDDYYIPVDVNVKAGQTCLSSWFERTNGGRISGDFITVEYVGKADPEELARYNNTNPDEILR